MNKPTLYIVCGIPGSGKSTFLKKIALPTEAIVSRDAIRYSFLKDDESYFKHEQKVVKVFYHTIAEFLKQGINVYADATHLTNMSRCKLLGALNKYHLDFDIEIIFFNVPTYICIDRNNERKGRERVPTEAILNMASNYEKPYHDYAKHLWIVNENQEVEKEW